MSDADEQPTPIERPLLRSDLNDIRDTVGRMNTMLMEWYEENKSWRKQSDETVIRVARIERNLWLPSFVSVVAAALAILARLAR